MNVRQLRQILRDGVQDDLPVVMQMKAKDGQAAEVIDVGVCAFTRARDGETHLVVVLRSDIGAVFEEDSA